MTKPLYEQIKQSIKDKIMDGTYPYDHKLPSENELSKAFKVSRITSKRALNDLEHEGLIYRLKGSGSYVQAQNTKPRRNLKDILFIMPFPDTQIFGNYTQGMLEALESTDYRLQIHQNKAFDEATLQAYLQDYAGVIFYPFHNQEIIDLAFPLYNLNIPTVILDKELAGVPFTSVISNNLQGGYEATKHLIDQGESNIAYVTSQSVSDVSSVRERYFGYLKAINEQGIHTNTSPLMYTPDENHTDLIINLLKNNIKALVCENDVIAISMMNDIKKEGYRIPHDFKVIGFDNTQASSLIDPPLSTIEQNFKALGEVAIQKLIEQIENETIQAEQIVIDVALIKRSSTQL